MISASRKPTPVLPFCCIRLLCKRKERKEKKKDTNLNVAVDDVLFIFKG